MSDFEKEYQKIINELEREIANKKDLEIAKTKLYDIYKYVVTSNRGINELIENQEKMRIDIDKLKRAVSNIEEDIYEDLEDDRYDDEYDSSYQEDKMHDNDYEFEITCPYCNYDFIADNSYINKVQIPCPKCKRVIDLDWSSTDEYSDDLDSESINTKYSDSEHDNFNENGNDNVNINDAVNEKQEQFNYDGDSNQRGLKIPKGRNRKNAYKDKEKAQDNSTNQDSRNNANNSNNPNNANNVNNTNNVNNANNANNSNNSNNSNNANNVNNGNDANGSNNPNNNNNQNNEDDM